MVEIAVKMEKERHCEIVKDKAKENSLNKVLDIIVGSTSSPETREKI